MKFNPDYELIIGRPSQINNYLIPKFLVGPTKLEQGVNGVGSDGFRFSRSPDGITTKSGDYLDYNTIPAKFYSIKDLQIIADIPESVEEGSKTTFQVTNLPDHIVKFIRKDDVVCFRAAYLSEVQERDQLPDIYIGQVQRCRSSFPDTDRVTVIECGAGQTIKRNSRISYSWPPSTTRETVIRDILKFLKNQGMPIGTFTLPYPTTKAYSIIKSPYLSGFSVQGNTMEELNKLLDACKLKGFISKGKYYIQPFISGIHRLSPIPTSTLFNISKSNIKGQPQPEDGDSSPEPTAADGKNSQQSLSVVLYMDSRIGLDSVLRLGDDLEDYQGDYKITSSRTIYDHRGGKYETVLKLVGVSNE